MRRSSPRSRITVGLSAFVLFAGLMMGIGSAQRPALAKEGPAPGLFVVRPEGAKGELVAYGMNDGRARFTLPAGMLSADGTRYVSGAVSGAATTLETFDPATGNRGGSVRLGGQWALSGISATGGWAALTRIPDQAEQRQRATNAGWKTDVLIVDAASGKTAHTVHLDGHFDVDTISAAGDSLFLIQHVPAINPDHYLVMRYDLGSGTLDDHPLRDKRAGDDVMTGSAWQGVATADGSWLLTLYLSTGRDTAFIHTLNLEQRYAICVDLPAGDGNMARLKDYTLTLGTDGQHLYAANPALGVVADVSLGDYQATRTVTFKPELPAAGAEPPAAQGRGVMAADGRTLSFTNGQDVWAYDTVAGQVSGPMRMAPGIVGLGLSQDGRRLYVARTGAPVAVMDTATGAQAAFPVAQGGA